MTNPNNNLEKRIIDEITSSNMPIMKKLIILKLLDKAFRKHLGVIYLSNTELEDNDILFRSM